MCLTEANVEEAVNEVTTLMVENDSEMENAIDQLRAMDIDPDAARVLVSSALMVLNPPMSAYDRSLMALTVLIVNTVAATRVAEGQPITTGHVEKIDMSEFEDMFDTPDEGVN